VTAAQLIILLRKEFTIELRKLSTVAGLGLYLLGTIFVYYLTFSFRQDFITPVVWSSLFWVTLLFAAISTVGKSFIGERNGRALYYYCLLSPASIIFSKMLYNFLLCATMALVGYVLFTLLLSNPVQDHGLFVATVLLASMAFSTSLTLLSGIASKTTNAHILMTVLGLPILIGVIMLAVSSTKNCIDGIDPSASYDELLTLGAINLLVTAVSYLLFPYIWRS
jgi:heme exporter protein B